MLISKNFLRDFGIERPTDFYRVLSVIGYIPGPGVSRPFKICSIFFMYKEKLLSIDGLRSFDREGTSGRTFIE